MTEIPSYNDLINQIEELNRGILEYQRIVINLSEIEDKFRTLANYAQHGMAIFQGIPPRFIYVNRFMIELTRYSEDEFLAMKPGDIWCIVHPEDREAAKSHLYKRLSGKKTADRYTIRLIRKNGELRWVEVFGARVEHYESPTSFSTFTDITARVNAETLLRASEERYRTIFTHSPVGIMHFDLNGVILDCNKKFSEISHLPKEKLIGVNLLETMPEGEAREAIEAALKKGSGFFEGNYTVTGTKYSSIRAFYRRIDDERGEFLGAVSVFEDISERKKLEAQLLQSQKMEAIGTLAGGIAHDFNNLMMGIQGYTSLMLMNLQPDHPYFNKLSKIENIISRGSELTQKLLGFARGGKYEVKLTNINELIRMQTAMFARTKKDIVMYEELAEDVWPVEADQSQIEQVLLNIYVNASQAMPDGGQLFIRSKNIYVGEEMVTPYRVGPGRYVRISITDTGMGMDEATQQRIFEPFFTTKEFGKGTGLGLASVYGIIKNHGGFITVYSQKGKGATFTIYLPASKKESLLEKKPDTFSVIRGNETLLLVDDEDIALDVERQLLTELGYTVLTAPNGFEALEVFKKNMHDISLVVLDMIMPGMGGGETFDRLKQLHPDVKVMLASGYTIDGEAKEIMDRGCNGFIQKPFSIEELSVKIRTILDRNPQKHDPLSEPKT